MTNQRTSLAVKNIGFSLFLKGLSILISFILVPMTIDYLNEYEYGVWLTLNSILSWVYLMDIGLGNGLRNKLTEAIANKDMRKGKMYVSTAFFFMTVIVVGFYLIFLVCQPFLNWYDILNVAPDSVQNLNPLVTIVFSFFCISFIFKLVGNIYMAYQLPAVNDLLLFIGNLLSLLIIYILTKTTSGTLEDVAVTYSAVPAIIYAIAYPITFLKYKSITPSLKAVKKECFHEIISLGAKFMIIQIAVLMIFMTSNVIISNILGPQEVTPYNIAFKYFSIITLGFNILMSPIWSAVTDAYSRNDLDWIRITLKRMLRIWGITFVVIVIMVLVAQPFYKLWVKEVSVPFSLTVWCGIYVVITTFNSIYTSIINGIGYLRIQLIVSLSQGILFIPLAILCCKHLSVVGIPIALCLCLVTNALWAPKQCQLILSGKAKGIWSK
ncbi:MAG: oligosaccharide flippase family protein [Paramuribaculum sp.]|nr:oligosaccharide flippase family protein [Paramuribaculum sp.]